MHKRHPANTKHFEQRLQNHASNAQTAANASISASQTVALVQKQTANTSLLAYAIMTVATDPTQTLPVRQQRQ